MWKRAVKRMICNIQVKESFVLRQSIILTLNSTWIPGENFLPHIVSHFGSLGTGHGAAVQKWENLVDPFPYILWHQASKKRQCRKKDVRMYLKGTQGVRGRKVIPTQTKSRLGPDSHLLAPKRGRLQQGEAHSDICPQINSAIPCFETRDPEVRYGVFVLCSL